MLEVSGITDFGIFTFSDVRPNLAPHPHHTQHRTPNRTQQPPHPTKEEGKALSSPPKRRDV